MSVTLGDLLSGTPMTFNNTSTSNYSSKAVKKMDKSKDYTLIDSSSLSREYQQPQDDFQQHTQTQYEPAQPQHRMQQQPQFQPYPPQQQHSVYIDDINPYSQMGQYNSNREIPDYNYKVGPSPVQNSINQLAHSNQVMQDVYGNQFINTTSGPLYIPRQNNPASISASQQANITQFGTFQQYPQFAAGMPQLQNAVRADKAIAMDTPLNQHFSVNDNQQQSINQQSINQQSINQQQQSNNEYFEHDRYNKSHALHLHHVLNCPICSRYIKCDNQIYVSIIFILIFLFSVILYMVTRK